jgi:hypothetical protein
MTTHIIVLKIGYLLPFAITFEIPFGFVIDHFIFSNFAKTNKLSYNLI